MPLQHCAAPLREPLYLQRRDADPSQCREGFRRWLKGQAYPKPSDAALDAIAELTRANAQDLIQWITPLAAARAVVIAAAPHDPAHVSLLCTPLLALVADHPTAWTAASWLLTLAAFFHTGL